jgi:hypothetical protein
MPQIFYALRCFSCGMFQVVQQKKTNKWACKICQEKQVGQPTVRMCGINSAHEREILLNVTTFVYGQRSHGRVSPRCQSQSSGGTPRVKNANIRAPLCHAPRLLHALAQEHVSLLDPSETFRETHVCCSSTINCALPSLPFVVSPVLKSVRQVFTEGAGKHCRVAVQELNMRKGEIETERSEQTYVEQLPGTTRQPSDIHSACHSATPLFGVSLLEDVDRHTCFWSVTAVP